MTIGLYRLPRRHRQSLRNVSKRFLEFQSVVQFFERADKHPASSQKKRIPNATDNYDLQCNAKDPPRLVRLKVVIFAAICVRRNDASAPGDVSALFFMAARFLKMRSFSGTPGGRGALLLRDI